MACVLCCDNSASSEAKSCWFCMLELRDLLLKTNPAYDCSVYVDERNPEIELVFSWRKRGEKRKAKSFVFCSCKPYEVRLTGKKPEIC